MKIAKVIIRHFMCNFNNSFVDFNVLLDSRYTNASTRRDKRNM